MKSFMRIFGKIAFLLVLFMAFTASKCPPCDLTNNKIDSARVVKTNITAPPGGPARRFLEVIASGFHPNAKATLSIQNFPTQSGGNEYLSVPVTFDAQGKIVWIKEPIPLLLNNGDPNVDITITIAEEGGACFSATKIKQSEFMKIN
jgi:hypothetical protein